MKIIADTDIPFVKKCFSAIGQVEIVHGRKITPAVVRQADVLLVRSITKVNSELLSASSVKFVGTATIGIDHIDTDFLNENNIAFASAPGSNANSVAEYIVVALLELALKYDIDLSGKLIGIIGAGNVGSQVAKKAKALAMTVLLNDPPLQRKTSEPKYLPLESLFECDFITMHTPLTFEGVDKTFHLADSDFFNSLKDGVVFLNTSRGAVTDTDALKEAVRSEKVKASVLDVWENEPNIDTELLRMVDIATPHIAGYSLDGKVGGMIMIYKAVCRHFNLQPKFNADSFLPAPAVGQLTIDDNDILSAVRKIYDIKADDSRLRKILSLPPEKTAEYFDSLRKNYPTRREFQNTKIVTGNQSIKNKLTGIGLKEK